MVTNLPGLDLLRSRVICQSLRKNGSSNYDFQSLRLISQHMVDLWVACSATAALDKQHPIMLPLPWKSFFMCLQECRQIQMIH